MPLETAIVPAIICFDKQKLSLPNGLRTTEFMIKTWHCNEKKVILFWKNNEVFARVYFRQDANTEILEREILSTDISIPKRALENLFLLIYYTNETYIRFGVRDDGSVMLYVNQRGKGGGLFDGILSALMIAAGATLMFVSPASGPFGVLCFAGGSGLVSAGLNGLGYAIRNASSEYDADYAIGYGRSIAGGFAAGAVTAGAGVAAAAVGTAIAPIAIGVAGGGVAQLLNGVIADGEINGPRILAGAFTGGLVAAAFSNTALVVAEDTANAAIVAADKSLCVKGVEAVLEKLPRVTTLACNEGVTRIHDCELQQVKNEAEQQVNIARQGEHDARVREEVVNQRLCSIKQASGAQTREIEQRNTKQRNQNQSVAQRTETLRQSSACVQQQQEHIEILRQQVRGVAPLTNGQGSAELPVMSSNRNILFAQPVNIPSASRSSGEMLGDESEEEIRMPQRIVGN